MLTGSHTGQDISLVWLLLLMALNAQLLEGEAVPPEEVNEMDDRIFFTILQKAGTWGDYQTVTTVLWCLIGYLCGGLLLITPFIFYELPYNCPQIYPDQSCLQYVCSLDPPLRIPFVPLSPMKTLASQFGDFRCTEERMQLDGLMTLVYLGSLVGNLVLTIIGDMMGRKVLMLLSLFFELLGLVLAIECTSLTVAAVGLFLTFAGVQSCFTICFYFIAETVEEELRSKISVAFQLFSGLGVLLNPFWFSFVGDWQQILAVFYFTPSVVVAVGVIFVVKDTPICLILRNSPEKAYQDFLFIGWMNNVRDFDLTVGLISEIKQNYSRSMAQHRHSRKNHTVFDLFRFQSLKRITCMLVLLQVIIAFAFYAPALLLEQFKMTLFVDGVVVGASEFISYPLCYFLINSCSRRRIAYGCFLTTLLCSVALLFIWNQGSESSPKLSESIEVLVLIFLFRFAVSVEYTAFLVYINELYPTQIRVIGTNFIVLTGGLMVTIAPELIDACLELGFPLMLLFAVCSVLAIYASACLPETYLARPPDVIREVKEVGTPQFVEGLREFSGLRIYLLLEKRKLRTASMYEMRSMLHTGSLM